MGLLLTFPKMPHASCSVLEDGGVGRWGFCSETFAEQVGEDAGCALCLYCSLGISPLGVSCGFRSAACAALVRRGGTLHLNENVGNTEALSAASRHPDCLCSVSATSDGNKVHDVT